MHSAGPRTLAADRSVYALWPLATGCHTIVQNYAMSLQQYFMVIVPGPPVVRLPDSHVYALWPRLWVATPVTIIIPTETPNPETGPDQQADMRMRRRSRQMCLPFIVLMRQQKIEQTQ